MGEALETRAMLPGLGTVYDLAKVEDAIQGLDHAQALYYDLRSFQTACRDRLREESDRLGQGTFQAGDRKVTVESTDAAMETVYDVQKLWDGLLAAGLPVERLAELVTYEPKVSGTIVRQLRKNAIYDKVISAAVQQQNPKVRSVRVK